MSSRFLIVAPLAVIITGALFFLMRDLIDAKAEKPEIVEAPEFTIGRTVKDPPPDDYDPVRPPDVVPPKIEPPKHNPADLRPGDPAFDGPGRPRLDPGPKGPLGFISGSAQPIIRGTQYPSCGTGAGEAVIDFVVEPDGSVSDIRVIRATSSCFGKAAERDARRWRYRPEVVDGQAVRSGRRQVTVQYVQEG